LKKFWVGYNAFALTVIVFLASADLMLNYGHSIENVDTTFMGNGFVVYGINMVIIMPILFIILFFTRKLMNKKMFLIGLGLFILFSLIGLFPFISYLGWATF
jgi:uncharacterized membrane protein